MRNNCLKTGVLFLFTVLTAFSAHADFGPGPDENAIAADRLRLEAMRVEMGEHDFVTWAIANLNRLLIALPAQHPKWEERSLTLGTPEHFAATFPHERINLIRMLGETHDERAEKILWDYILLGDQRLSAFMTYSLQAAWLQIAPQEASLDSCILKLMETRQANSHAISRFIEMEKINEQFLFSPDPTEPDDPHHRFVLELVPMLKSSGMTQPGLQIIELLAKYRLWDLSEEAVEIYLTLKNPRVRLAIASILYIQDAHAQSMAPDRQFLEGREADRARDAMRQVWRDALDERERLLNEMDKLAAQTPLNIKEIRSKQHYIQRNQLILRRVNYLCTFLQFDPTFLDLCLESAPYLGVGRVVREVERGNFTLDAQAAGQIQAVLLNRWSTDEVKRGSAIALIKLDYRPAADDIQQQLEEIGVLKGFDHHPQVLLGNRMGVGDQTIAWLKEHTTKEKPEDRPASVEPLE